MYEKAAKEPANIERKLTTILHADVHGHSRLMGANEEETLRTLTAYRQVTDARIHQHRGRVVGTAGHCPSAVGGSRACAHHGNNRSYPVFFSSPTQSSSLVTQAEPTPALPLLDKPSIVVLPFVNMSEDPKQEHFSDGLTEDLTSDLSKISSLFVIARNSAFTYRGRAAKVQEISKELGVRYVLEGSVQKGSEQVRITAQMKQRLPVKDPVEFERYIGALRKAGLK